MNYFLPPYIIQEICLFDIFKISFNSDSKGVNNFIFLLILQSNIVVCRLTRSAGSVFQQTVYIKRNVVNNGEFIGAERKKLPTTNNNWKIVEYHLHDSILNSGFPFLVTFLLGTAKVHTTTYVSVLYNNK